MKRVKSQAVIIGTMAIALSASLLLGSVTNDRVYLLGDHNGPLGTIGSVDEGAVAGNPVGFNTSDGFEITFDSEVDGGSTGLFDFQRLEAHDHANDGSPHYVDITRPNAIGTLGVTFDGINDRLEGRAFNRPDWYWNQDAFGNDPGYPRNYKGITNRGTQLWVKPTDVNGTRQDILLDSSQFGGVVITENNKWGMAWDMDDAIFFLGGGGGIFESAADVQEDAWAHVMQVSLRGIRNGVLYINGVAVVSSHGIEPTGAIRSFGYDRGPKDEDRTPRVFLDPEPLFIGGSDLDGDNTYENFFQGDIDDVAMFLWGDNSSQAGPPAGQDWGTFNLLEDNEYIAQQIAASQGFGDINLDGALNQADVDVYIANWLATTTKELIGMTAVDFDSYKMGDLDMNGVVNLDDWILLRQAFIDDGQAAPVFDLNSVPEPATMTLLGLGGLAMLRRRNRRQSNGEKKMSNVKSIRSFGLVLVALVGLMVTSAQAQVIRPTSSNRGNTINGSGLSDVALVETGSPIPDAWPTHILGDSRDPNFPRIERIASRVNSGGVFTAVYQLGATYEVDGLALWNYNERWKGNYQNGRGLKNVPVEYSSDGGQTWNVLETLNFARIADGVFDADAEVQSFSSSVTANAIRFNEATAHDSTKHVGLGEVRFTGAFMNFDTHTLLINRDTGAMSLEDFTGQDFEMIAYSILSPSGSVDSAAWTSIASTDNDWSEFSAAGTTTDLSEGTFGQKTLGANTSIALGNAWQKSPFEDISITLKAIDPDTGEVVDQIVNIEYTGNGDESFAAGDFDLDGAIDEADWVILRDNLHVAHAEDATLLASFVLGDMDKNNTTDRFDFEEFKAAFDAANGAGAFATMVNDVPEPATMALLGLGGLAMLRRRRNNGVKMMNKVKPIRHFGLVLAAMACLLVANNAQAEIAVQNGSFELEVLVEGKWSNGATDFWDVGFGKPFVEHLKQDSDNFTSHNQVPDGVNGGGLNGNAAFDQLLITDTGDPYLFDPTKSAHFSAWLGNRNGPPSNLLTVQLIGASGTVYYQGQYDVDANVPNQTWLENDFDLLPAGQGAVASDIGQQMTLRLSSGAGKTQIWMDVVTLNEIEAGAVDALTMEVNTTTGKGKIVNASGVAHSLGYYEITSPSGALDVASWNSLADQGSGTPGSGDDWEEAGGSSANILSEGFLTGQTEVADGTDLSLGNVFSTGSTEDLIFTYRGEDGEFHTTFVTYVEGGVILGDVNGDGLVNGFDVDPFVDVLLKGPYQVEADMNEDGAVDGFDVDPFVDAVLNGGVAPESTEVPEPATLVLLGLGGLAALRRRQR